MQQLSRQHQHSGPAKNPTEASSFVPCEEGAAGRKSMASLDSEEAAKALAFACSVDSPPESEQALDCSTKISASREEDRNGGIEHGDSRLCLTLPGRYRIGLKSQATVTVRVQVRLTGSHFMPLQ